MGVVSALQDQAKQKHVFTADYQVFQVERHHPFLEVRKNFCISGKANLTHKVF